MKLEFSDLYRFLVSMGLAAIAISVIAPWMFLSGPLGASLTAEEVAALSEGGQVLQRSREKVALLLVWVLPWFAGVMLIGGLAAVSFGLRAWYRKTQRLMDEERELRIDKMRSDAPPEQVNRKRMDEAKDVLAEGDAAKTDFSASEVTRALEEVSKTEHAVIQRLREAYSAAYLVQADQLVGGRVVDVVLRSPLSPGIGALRAPDYLIEIKVLHRQEPKSWFNRALGDLRQLLLLYADETQVIPRGRLIVVGSVDVIAGLRSKGVVEGVQKEWFRKVRAAFLTLEEIQTANVDEFGAALGIPP